MRINSGIFKAYDIRGLYPGEINEEIARQIGRGFVSYLNASQIGVSRDMRLSSPAIAGAFIEGAREQGANVIDYGMLGTDMMYYAVVKDNLQGGAQITECGGCTDLTPPDAGPSTTDAGEGETDAGDTDAGADAADASTDAQDQ